MQGDSLFKDYCVYSRDLGTAFKVPLPVKKKKKKNPQLLESLCAFSLSSLSLCSHIFYM